MIENKVSVYFDIDPAFQTNKAWHTVSENFLITSGVVNPGTVKTMVVYPNPAVKQTFLRIDETEVVHVRLINMLGQSFMHLIGKARGITLERGKTPSGMYQIEVQSADKWLKSGKLVWE